MATFLEDLLKNRISALDREIQRSDEYFELKGELNRAIEDWLSRTRVGSKPFLESLLTVGDKRQKAAGKDSFMRGFCLGSLASIEVHINQEKYIPFTLPFLSPASAPENDSAERLYIPIITQALSDECNKGALPHQDNVRNMRMEEDYLTHLKRTSYQTQLDADEASELETRLLTIFRKMLFLINKKNFGIGYSLGTTIIGDTFHFCDQMITE